MKLWGDLETYSATPISHGTYRYAANAEIMLYAWAIDDEPAQVWDLTDGSEMPFRLRGALHTSKCEVWFHNSMFDRTVKRAFMPERTPPIARWRDTMVQALCHSMPGKLSTLCEVLGVDADKAKSKRGAYLVQLFCKPRGKNSKVERATRETHPAEWAEFVDYARLDVEAMREVHKKLPTWNYRGDELALWHLDQTINDRGLAVDLDLVHAAVAAVAEEQIALAAATSEMTGGAVEAATQRDAMLQHMLAEYGVQLPNMQASTLERRLEDPDVPEAMKNLLRVRLQSSTTSTAKYITLQRATNLDGRIRGLLQFAGASRTARWCLAEGSLVKTRASDGTLSDTPIERVTTDDQVWDGRAWVAHEGVVFSGEKTVIEHDGVRATPEHRVYLSDTESVTLGEASARGAQLWKGEPCFISTN